MANKTIRLNFQARKTDVADTNVTVTVNGQSSIHTLEDSTSYSPIAAGAKTIDVTVDAPLESEASDSLPTVEVTIQPVNGSVIFLGATENHFSVTDGNNPDAPATNSGENFSGLGMTTSTTELATGTVYIGAAPTFDGSANSDRYDFANTLPGGGELGPIPFEIREDETCAVTLSYNYYSEL